MATFSRFEEIQAWQKARIVTNQIYNLTKTGPCSRDFGLRDQLRRASVSIMANIAEGHGRRTNKDFANFLVFAHGSATEVQSHLYVALDLGYIAQEDFRDIYEELDEISRMLNSLARYLLRTSTQKGASSQIGRGGS